MLKRQTQDPSEVIELFGNWVIMVDAFLTCEWERTAVHHCALDNLCNAVIAVLCLWTVAFQRRIGIWPRRSPGYSARCALHW